MHNEEYFKNAVDKIMSIVMPDNGGVELTDTEKELARRDTISVQVFAARLHFAPEKLELVKDDVKALLHDLWITDKLAVMHLVEMFRVAGMGIHTEALPALGAALGLVEAAEGDKDNQVHILCEKLGEGMPFLRFFSDREPVAAEKGTVINFAPVTKAGEGAFRINKGHTMPDGMTPMESDPLNLNSEDYERLLTALDKSTSLCGPDVADKMNLPTVLVVPANGDNIISYGFGQNPYRAEHEFRPAILRLMNILREGLRNDSTIDFAFYMSKVQVAQAKDAPRIDVLQVSVYLRSQEEPLHFVGQTDAEGIVEWSRASFSNGTPSHVHLLR